MFNKVKPSSSPYSSHPTMSVTGIQGQLLEITVVGCNKLKDTEWISRQDPYVILEYGSTKYRTRTCTDGGKNPTFQEKFVFNLIEGLRELNVVVYNSNTINYDDFIGNGKILFQKVLSEGYDDTAWPLQDKRGRHAGEVRLIMHYSNANKPAKTHGPSAPYASAPPVPPYSAPPLASYPPSSYPQTGYPPSSYPQTSYPQTSYPPSSYPQTSYPPAPHVPSYPPNSAGYPPQQYHQPAAAAYPPAYPPTSSYPPQSAYPPQGAYPPAPYPPPPF